MNISIHGCLLFITEFIRKEIYLLSYELIVENALVLGCDW